jgi:NADH-quinone oxidoreductase subunit N
MGGFISPVLNYSLLAPILILLGGALIGVLVEAFASRDKRPAIQLVLTLTTLALSLGWVIRNRGNEATDLAGNSVVFDGAAFLIQMFVLIVSILGTLLIADEKNFTSSASALPGS